MAKAFLWAVEDKVCQSIKCRILEKKLTRAMWWEKMVEHVIYEQTSSLKKHNWSCKMTSYQS